MIALEGSIVDTNSVDTKSKPFVNYANTAANVHDSKVFFLRLDN